MTNVANMPLVSTIRERCRVCYTCVRECPAKAIRIFNGQAEVLTERCIGCGNCVRVCSQNAKKALGFIDKVNELLDSPAPVAACIAPSFPAHFYNIDPSVLVGMIRVLGFNTVHEVASGADLVADRYQNLLKTRTDGRFIATSCPAVVGFVERYHPKLIPFLAPIVSPMIATGRFLRRLHGAELKIVFIGPCIAKKAEAIQEFRGHDVDAVLTFIELEQMFLTKGVNDKTVSRHEFDPPAGGAGALFPITRGMLQAASLDEDLVRGEIVVADGRTNFVEAIKEFESGDLDAKLLEVLCCDGCIMGPGIDSPNPLFSRRSQVSRYVRRKMKTFDFEKWNEHLKSFQDLNLSRSFINCDMRKSEPKKEDLKIILLRMGKTDSRDELNCGACGYDTCHEHAVAIYSGLAESEMCLPYTIDLLRSTIKELAVSNEELARVQEALVRSEKLASMGHLAAGIAHEVNNPLGVVLMYAHILLEKCEDDSPLKGDIEMITDHTDRCKKIVSGLLNFARQTKVDYQPSDIDELIDRCLSTMQFPDCIKVQVEHTLTDRKMEVDRDQISQVLVNLLTNAVDAMPKGGDLEICTAENNGKIEITVTDSGTGINKENLSKIFEPFYTTKDIGKGTGLGLSVTYGIVKMHQGDIHVQSNTDFRKGPTYTTFTVTLPRNRQEC